MDELQLEMKMVRANIKDVADEIEALKNEQSELYKRYAELQDILIKELTSEL